MIKDTACVPELQLPQTLLRCISPPEKLFGAGSLLGENLWLRKVGEEQSFEKMLLTISLARRTVSLELGLEQPN